ncbi:MAG TPA: sulfur carrier protein ThiS [Candidatus Goldiibacteriota bacterium]|nr:sulfur carrier protein ThiS [Candidatus Goldiibacteriota bacterium]
MKLNGKQIKIKDIITLQELIDLYKYDVKNVAVLVNERIIKSSQWNDYNLSEDDNVEIIGFVGGG